MTQAKYVLGLTGGIGSGKSTVATMFAALGTSIVDTDEIAHRLTAEHGLAIPTISAQFGDTFFLPSGALDRAKMRQEVFKHPERRLQLEQILHPLIRQEAGIEMEQATGDYVICVIPLLVESPSWKLKLQRILVVDCDEATQIRRVMRRSGIDEARVREIMQAQVSRAERLAAADDVIENNGDLLLVREAVKQLHSRYTKFAQSPLF